MNKHIQWCASEAAKLSKPTDAEVRKLQKLEDIYKAVSLIASALKSVDSLIDTLEINLKTAHPEFRWHPQFEKKQLRKALADRKKFMKKIMAG